MAMTGEQAKKWLEEAERKDVADVSWAELQEAIMALKMIVVGLTDQPYLERALQIAHRKAAPHLMNARAGDVSEETVSELSEAARTVRASANARGQLAPVDEQFIAEIGRTFTRSQRAEPRRGRGPVADTIERGRRDSAALERRFREAGAAAGYTDAEVEQAWTFTQVTAQAQGVSAEEAIEQQIAEWEAEAIEAQGPPMAPPGMDLPPGFETVRNVELDPADRARFGSAESAQVPIPARYFEDDVLELNAMRTEDLVELQQRMVEAGLLEGGEYWAGFADEHTVKAFKQALGYANFWGLTWESTLDRLAVAEAERIAGLEEDEAGGRSASEILAESYLAPDYATLAQNVKQMFRSRLGRDPSEQELAELAGSLGGLYRAQFDAELDVMRRAEAAAEEGLEGPVSGTAVDPAARFAELFEQRFKPEMDRLDSLSDVRQNTENVFESLRTMQSMMGG